LPREWGSSKTRFSHLLLFFGDGFNLLHIAFEVLWAEMSTSGPVPPSCCWGMRDVAGSALCLDPSSLLWKLRRAAQEPSLFLPGLTLFPLGHCREDRVECSQRVVSSLLPLRAAQEVSTAWIIFANALF